MVIFVAGGEHPAVSGEAAHRRHQREHLVRAMPGREHADRRGGEGGTTAGDRARRGKCTPCTTPRPQGD